MSVHEFIKICLDIKDVHRSTVGPVYKNRVHFIVKKEEILILVSEFSLQYFYN